MNLTLFNLVYLFLKGSSFSQKNEKEFRKKFIAIVADLSMNENEFINFILLFEYYTGIFPINNLNIENLRYIGIISKVKLNPDFSYNFQNINKKDEFEKINSILNSKEIKLKEFNKKYNLYNKLLKANKERFYLDFEKIVDNLDIPLNQSENNIQNSEQNNNNNLRSNNDNNILENNNNHDEIENSIYYSELNYEPVNEIYKHDYEIFMEKELKNHFNDKEGFKKSLKNLPFLQN